MRLLKISILSFLITTAYAHGRITQITTAAGDVYEGSDPASSNDLILPRSLAAWSASNLGNTYIPPSQFNTSNISCYYNALPGVLHIPITAGEELEIQWNEWPTSHVEPVMTYLAECQGSCADAKKEGLQWMKVDELGWLNSIGWDVIDLGGIWAANEFSWVVKIPEILEEGNYVLRHEIIALHVAEKVDGAQAYPQCVNLRVAGRGMGGEVMRLERGVKGWNLYSTRDEGILVDVHGKTGGYRIPGPKICEYATPVKQANQ